MKNTFVTLLLMLILLGNSNPLLGQWVTTNLPDAGSGSEQVFCFALGPDGTTLYAGTTAGVYRTSDYGTHWTRLSGTGVYALTYLSTFLFGGTSTMTYGGVVRSSDNGSNWSAIGLSYLSVNAFTTIGTNLFAATSGGGVYYTTDYGSHWIQTDTTGLASYPVGALITTPVGAPVAELYAGTTGNGLFCSPDFGKHWLPINVGLPDKKIMELCFQGATLLAATYGHGVFRSTDYGASWLDANTGLTNHNIGGFISAGGNLFAGGWGVYQSSNSGMSWRDVSDGLNNSYSRNVNALIVAGNTVFAGTFAGVWKRPLSEIATNIEEGSSSTPVSFSLKQNYPNPFNPSTVISYQLPASSRVFLKVFDVLGREVKVLINERQNVGKYSVTFDAAGLPSGMYFYCLQAGVYQDTKKLLLIR